MAGTVAMIVKVAIAIPLRAVFDYLLPAEMDAPQIGARVKAPFGERVRVGIALAVCDHSEVSRDRLRPLLAVLDSEPLLTAECLSLLEWASDYFHHPIGEVVIGALPSALRSGAAATAPPFGSWRYHLTAAGAAVTPAQLKRAPKQHALLQRIAEQSRGLADTGLNGERAQVRAMVKKLIAKGWVSKAHDNVAGPPPRSPPRSPIALNADQQVAVDTLQATTRGCYLLEGVTGSGKTEVYLALIRKVVAQGSQVLVLIPEIALTLHIKARFCQSLDCEVVMLHSALSDKERANAWLSARSGTAKVIIGTRSAVFVPVAELGLIIVDEEHDPSFKQQEGFRYSARDLAIVRAQRRRIPIVLGSATPSLETLHNVYRKRYGLIRLPKRAGDAMSPALTIIDIRSRRLTDGLSQPLAQAIKECLESGKQALLFVNRRGYAPLLTCYECGWISECRHCDARMTWHRETNQLRCHHCAAITAAVDTCPACGDDHLLALGIGVQRCVAALQKLLPQARVARIDSDSTQRRGSLEQILQRVHEGDIDILVGTQMIAKGHHFARVTLVGIVDADSGFYGVDLRAPERMGQLLTQVAGRAGREGTVGTVLIQTRHPDHPLLHTLIRDGYRAFSDQLLTERKAANMAPFSYLSLLRAEARGYEEALQFVQRAADCAHNLRNEVAVSSPVPAPMVRRAGRYRVQMLLQASNRIIMQRFLQRWIAQLEALPGTKRVRWSIDVDPQDMS